MLSRRALLARGAAASTAASLASFANPATGAQASAGPLGIPLLRFPRDFGAHPDLRTEWWYVTGHASSSAPGRREFGFQLTFFRTRIDAAQSLNSVFAAKQLVFAHAAVTDVQGQRLWHDQRAARAGFGMAVADTEDTRLSLDGWTLQRQANGVYVASLPAQDFELQLQFTTTQPLILQGQQGLSRKGPDPRQASYYYSLPQLQATGRITLRGQAFDVAGKAWLDHEWSEEILHPEARGWDWTGMNLDDGGALTAFRLRNAEGGAVWDGGSYRSAQGELRIFKRGEVIFQPLRSWTSPLTKASYPVEWALRTPAGLFRIKAVIDPQELDSRQSTGTVYWEGLSDLLDTSGRRVGRGYLEMTGYAAPLKL